MGRTASPSRRKVPERATTRSPSPSPSRTSTSAPAARPVFILRGLDPVGTDHLHGCTVRPVEDGGGRHGKTGAAGRGDGAAGKGADAQAGLSPRKMRTRPSRVALSTSADDQTHGAVHFADSGDLDAGGLADLDGGKPRLGDLRVELDLALGDDAEHGLGGASGIAADAGHAAADDAVGRRRHLHASAPPGELAALGLDLRLLGFGDLQAIAGRSKLSLRRAGRLLALVEYGFRQMAGLAQRLGTLEGVAAFHDPRLGLDDGGPGLGDGRGGAGERGVVLGELGVERVGDQAGEHVALLHARAFVGQHLGDAQALDLGPDQDLLARDQRAGGEHRLGEVGRRDARDGHDRATKSSAGACLAAWLSAGPVGLGSDLPTSVREIMTKQTASTTPISIFLMTDPHYEMDCLSLCCCRCCRHGFEQPRDHLQHGGHQRAAVEGRIDGAAPEQAVADHGGRPA